MGTTIYSEKSTSSSTYLRTCTHMYLLDLDFFFSTPFFFFLCHSGGLYTTSGNIFFLKTKKNKKKQKQKKDMSIPQGRRYLVFSWFTFIFVF